MKVRDLIVHLESLATPDASIFAQGEYGAPFLLLGGYTGETSGGTRYVVLASRSLTSQEDGF